MNFVYKQIFDKQTQEIITAIEELHIELFSYIYQRIKSLYNIITFDLSIEDIYVPGLYTEGLPLDENYVLRLKVNFVPFNIFYYDLEDFQIREFLLNRFFLPKGNYIILNDMLYLTSSNPNIVINPPIVNVLNNTIVHYQKNQLFLTNLFTENIEKNKVLTILNPLLSFYSKIIDNIFSINLGYKNHHKNIIKTIEVLKNFLYQPTEKNTLNLIRCLLGKYIPSEIPQIINFTNHPLFNKIYSYPSFDYIVYHRDYFGSIDIIEPHEYEYVFVVNKGNKKDNIFFTRILYKDILNKYKHFENLNTRFSGFIHSQIKNIRKVIIINIRNDDGIWFGPYFNHLIKTLHIVNELLPFDIRLGIYITGMATL